MRARDIIYGALMDLGVLAAGATPSSEDAADCLTALNDMGDALGIERLTLYKIVRTAKTLTSGTASYTIGSGASIDVVKPVWIDYATLVTDTTASTPTEVSIPVLDEAEYAGVSQKTLQASQSSAVFYDHGHSSSGYGLIYPLPIPNVSTTQLVLYTPGGEVSAFADLTTDYALPRGYKRALRKNLAMEIASMFDVEPSARLTQQARDSKDAIKMVSVMPPVLRADRSLTGASGHWNINIDAPNRFLP